jgi:hypothetical protein
MAILTFNGGAVNEILMAQHDGRELFREKLDKYSSMFENVRVRSNVTGEH